MPAIRATERSNSTQALFAIAKPDRRRRRRSCCCTGSAAIRPTGTTWPQRIDTLIVEDTPPPTGSNLPEPPPEPPSPVPFEWAVARTILAQLNDPDPGCWDRLPDIRARTLIIGGGATSPIPQDRLADVAALIPGARLVTIDAGHRVHATKPAEYIAVLREFLFASDARAT